MITSGDFHLKTSGSGLSELYQLCQLQQGAKEAWIDLKDRNIFQSKSFTQYVADRVSLETHTPAVIQRPRAWVWARSFLKGVSKWVSLAGVKARLSHRPDEKTWVKDVGKMIKVRASGVETNEVIARCAVLALQCGMSRASVDQKVQELMAHYFPKSPVVAPVVVETPVETSDEGATTPPPSKPDFAQLVMEKGHGEIRSATYQLGEAECNDTKQLMEYWNHWLICGHSLDDRQDFLRGLWRNKNFKDGAVFAPILQEVICASGPDASELQSTAAGVLDRRPKAFMRECYHAIRQGEHKFTPEQEETITTLFHPILK